MFGHFEGVLLGIGVNPHATPQDVLPPHSSCNIHERVREIAMTVVLCILETL